jgi:uncharacterized protein
VSRLSLPVFRYHPDPLATGSVQESSGLCAACERERGYIYVGPVYAEGDFKGAICPWCIADGSAARRFGASFTDVGGDVPDDVPEAVVAHISTMTPGFVAWQEGHWLYHCGDGCAYLGPTGWDGLEAHPDARAVLMHEHDGYGRTEDESRGYVDGLSVDGDATAYLFRCLVCGAHLAYSDSL